MGKKLISSILVVAFLNLLGCNPSELMTVTVPEYKQFEKKEGKPDEIKVKTRDTQKYHFSNSNFYIENDTLYGKATFKEERFFRWKIALGEIESFQIESFTVPASGYKKIVAKSGKPDEIYVTKLDSTKYHFMKDNYFIENDTLYGNGKGIFFENELLDRSIALSEIESIAFETSVSVNTAAVFGAVLLVAAILVLLGSINPKPIEWDEKS